MVTIIFESQNTTVGSEVHFFVEAAELNLFAGKINKSLNRLYFKDSLH